MIIKHIKQIFATSFLLGILLLSGCQTSNVPAATTATETVIPGSQAPEHVDVRGSIVTRRYNQGQVMLEVDGFGISPDSRYNRAYVLVLPTTQIVDQEGRTISLSELNQGQEVAVLLRSGGQGNFVGAGVARKLWVEDRY